MIDKRLHSLSSLARSTFTRPDIYTHTRIHTHRASFINSSVTFMSSKSLRTSRFTLVSRLTCKFTDARYEVGYGRFRLSASPALYGVLWASRRMNVGRHSGAREEGGYGSFSGSSRTPNDPYERVATDSAGVRIDGVKTRNAVVVLGSLRTSLSFYGVLVGIYRSVRT